MLSSPSAYIEPPFSVAVFPSNVTEEIVNAAPSPIYIAPPCPFSLLFILFLKITLFPISTSPSFAKTSALDPRLFDSKYSLFPSSVITLSS